MSDYSERKKGDRGIRRERDLQTKSSKVEAWLRTKLPDVDDFAMTPLRATSEGFSNETYFFEVSYTREGASCTEPLVARWAPSHGSLFEDHDVLKQCRVLQQLAHTDVPVAQVRWVEESAEPLGVPFFIMDRVDGVVPPGRLRSEGLFYDATPEVRTLLWQRAVSAMAAVHDVEWRDLDLDFLGVPGPGTDPLDRQIARYERQLAWATADEPIPVLDAAIRWLKANTFTPARVTLCWGDARPGNLIYRDGHVVSVLDWEMAYVGAPETDLAWFSALEPTYGWPFGAPPLPGIPDEAATVRFYEHTTGRPVEHYRFHQVLALLQLGTILVPHARNIVKAGIAGYPADFATNNVATQGLDRLLS
jgi:aminoglycoside phosphotransferase (APT) family kinase protein